MAPSGTKIKKLRNGESPLPRPLGHRTEKSSDATKDTSCPRPAGFRLCHRSADKESHRTAEAPSRVRSATERRKRPARWNTLRVRRDERHFVSAVEHASRPRLFFCASSPVSKKAIEWPPSGTKIKKLRNGERPLPRPLGHRTEKSSGATEHAARAAR